MPNHSLKFGFPQFNAHRIALVIIVGFFLLMLSMLQTKFPIFMDEAIFSNIINRFNQGLGFNTTLFKDFIPYVEHYSYWYPPIYFLVLVPVYLIFGASITVGRLFSLICGITTLGLIYNWSKKIFKFKYSGILVLLLLTTDHYFQDGSIVARMELLTLVWGLGALICHTQFLKKRKPNFNLASGIFSALSLLTHPTAVIMLLPIGLNLLFLKEKNFKQKIITCLNFGLPILVALATWIISFWPNREIFILQNLVQMHRKKFATVFIIEIFKYQPLPRLVLTIYFISNALFVGRNFLHSKGDAKKRMLLLLALTTALLPIFLKEMWYVVYATVFSSIILVKNLEIWWQKEKITLVSTILAGLIMLNSFIFFDNVSTISKQKTDYETFSKTISDQLPANSRVLLSSFPDPFFYLEKNRPDLELQSTPNSPPNEPIDPDVYNKILDKIDYVVLSFYLNQHLYTYINNNLDKIIFENNAAGGYKVWLIKLKPQTERERLEPPLEQTWKYPRLGEN